MRNSKALRKISKKYNRQNQMRVDIDTFDSEKNRRRYFPVFSAGHSVKDNWLWGRRDGRHYREHFSRVRVPSLKRNYKTWKNFYLLFPSLYWAMQKNKSYAQNGVVYVSGYNLKLRVMDIAEIPEIIPENLDKDEHIYLMKSTHQITSMNKMNRDLPKIEKQLKK